MKSSEDLSETDVFFSPSEVEDLEATVRILLQAAFWWFCAAKSLAIRDASKMAKVKCLFIAGARTELPIAKISSTIWVNALPKHHNTILAKMKDNINFESFMELST